MKLLIYIVTFIAISAAIHYFVAPTVSDCCCEVKTCPDCCQGCDCE